MRINPIKGDHNKIFESNLQLAILDSCNNCYQKSPFIHIVLRNSVTQIHSLI